MNIFELMRVRTEDVAQKVIELQKQVVDELEDEPPQN